MLRRERSGHSPSIRPTIVTVSKSPNRAAWASSRCTPAALVCGSNVCSSIQRRMSGARSSIVATLSPCEPCAAASDRRTSTIAEHARADRAPASGLAWAARKEARAVSCVEAGAGSVSGCSASAARTTAASASRTSASPCEIRDEAAKPFDVPEVLLLVESPIETGQGPARQARADRKLRRSQQRQGRGSREPRRDELDDQIERRRGRLGGQRQPIDSLVRHPGAAEHFVREVEIRERPGKHHGRGVRAITVVCGAPGDSHQFFFPIAVNPDRHAVLPAGRHDRRNERGAQAERIRVHRVEPGQPVVDTLVEPRSQQAGRGDDVELLEARYSCQQIEIDGEQAVGIGNPVAHRHHHAAKRARRGVLDQVRPQTVFVDSESARRDAARKPGTTRPENASGAAAARRRDRCRRPGVPRGALRIDRRFAPAAGAGRRTASSRRRDRGAAETAVWRPCRPSARRRYAE